MSEQSDLRDRVDLEQAFQKVIGIIYSNASEITPEHLIPLRRLFMCGVRSAILSLDEGPIFRVMEIVDEQIGEHMENVRRGKA